MVKLRTYVCMKVIILLESLINWYTTNVARPKGH